MQMNFVGTITLPMELHVLVGPVLVGPVLPILNCTMGLGEHGTGRTIPTFRAMSALALESRLNPG